MTFLTDEELDGVTLRVFRNRESTLEEEGRKLELTDLFQTVQRIRHRMNVAVDGLPLSAFESQPDDEDGKEVWNAGQIISHICHSQRNLTNAVGELVEYTREIDTGQLDTEPELNRADTLGAIKTATILLRQLINAIPENADLSGARDHARFGPLGVRGWLMLMAIHERDHVQQLQSLA